MGLIKLKVYINMMEYFEKLKNKKIDMTTFINLTIQKNIKAQCRKNWDVLV